MGYVDIPIVITNTATKYSADFAKLQFHIVSLDSELLACAVTFNSRESTNPNLVQYFVGRNASPWERVTL